MLGFEIPEAYQAYVALGIVAGMFALFLSEKLAPEIVAMAGAALMLVLGLLPIKDATETLAK